MKSLELSHQRPVVGFRKENHLALWFWLRDSVTLMLQYVTLVVLEEIYCRIIFCAVEVSRGVRLTEQNSSFLLDNEV